jgi:hypothetical protein
MYHILKSVHCVKGYQARLGVSYAVEKHSIEMDDLFKSTGRFEK